MLEVGSVLPSSAHQLRWLGEPVKTLTLSTDVFIPNRKGTCFSLLVQFIHVLFIIIVIIIIIIIVLIITRRTYINMRRYITSARGHELSGRVRAHAYNYYYGWTECAWVAK